MVSLRCAAIGCLQVPTNSGGSGREGGHPRVDVDSVSTSPVKEQLTDQGSVLDKAGQVLGKAVGSGITFSINSLKHRQQGESTHCMKAS